MACKMNFIIFEPVQTACSATHGSVGERETDAQTETESKLRQNAVHNNIVLALQKFACCMRSLA